jgi:hypothetical protein
MKIGIEVDNYSGIVTFEVDDEDIKSNNLLQLLLTAKSCSKDSVDMIIKVKEDKNKKQTNE